MNKKIVVAILLLCITLCMVCSDTYTERKSVYVEELIIEPMNESILNESILVPTTPELDNLIQFLEEDKIDELKE